MTSHIEREPDAWSVNLPRDASGFSRPTETAPGSRVFFVMGPDDLSHAMYCDFISERGVLPCSCDATRRQYPRRGPDARGRDGMGWWYRCWVAWAHCRVSPYETRRERVPWPVEGPDGVPWIDGRDFQGQEADRA